MNRLDSHIHIWETEYKSTELIKSMEAAGISGGCVFSPPPHEMDMEQSLGFDERLDCVLNWTKNHSGILFPVLWIHPDEENIKENITRAVQRGIMAFKIICNNFYVYEPKSLDILEHIANLGKPVFFHTGILWDGGVSSRYNRPLDWECLIKIKNLKFSMGHCSWPWHDECIALYGKFLNAYRNKECAEMFFDITPGTPEIYRRDLMTKLFNIGYDVPKNIFFGTDNSAGTYNNLWAKKWIDTDTALYAELGLSDDIVSDIYHNNLMRFLGLFPKSFTHLTPTTDNGAPWSIGVKRPEKTVCQLAREWYGLLDFPKEYHREFEALLSTYADLKHEAPELYELSDHVDKRGKNLVMFLYFAQVLSEKYKSRNIPHEILLDTLGDIVTWTNTNMAVTGSLGVCEASWLSRHLGFKLFRLGRLQFAFGKSEADIPDVGVKKGDNIIEVHIPEGEPLSIDACNEAFKMAKDFFARYFPEYSCKCFTCHSWLLDETLNNLAKPGSNILKFSDLFTKVYKEKSDAILRYTFAWDTTGDNLAGREAKSTLAQRIKEHYLSGGDFYEVYGYKII